VCHLLKKHRLDAGDMKSYRPVSNLPFLSKLLERVVQTQLQSFLDSSGLMPTKQSAYRQFHSTKTAVTRVYNDLLQAADGGQVSVLYLLDLSTAFDTVDHELLTLRLERQLLSVLHQRFGGCDNALTWVGSYMSDRTQNFFVNGVLSGQVAVDCIIIIMFA